MGEIKRAAFSEKALMFGATPAEVRKTYDTVDKQIRLLATESTEVPAMLNTEFFSPRAIVLNWKGQIEAIQGYGERLGTFLEAHDEKSG